MYKEHSPVNLCTEKQLDMQARNRSATQNRKEIADQGSHRAIMWSSYVSVKYAIPALLFCYADMYLEGKAMWIRYSFKSVVRIFCSTF